MNQPFFSIIIPVYNVEIYLEECIRSILIQTSNDYEIILVDDGSTDNSKNICKKYSEMYANIKCFRIENRGASVARNFGIKKSNGKYIAFLDSDDFWCDKELLIESKKILLKTKADMIIFGYRELYENGKEKIIITPKAKENVIYTYTDVENLGMYKSSAWSKFVKSQIIKENNLLFEEGVTSEDIIWCAELAKICDNYCLYNSAPYVYRQRSGSVTKNIDIERFRQLVRHMKELNLIKYDDNKKIPANNYIAYQYITVLYYLIFYLDKINSMEYKEIKDMSYLLKYKKNKKVNLIYWVNRILGFDLMIKLLKKYIERRK